MNYHPEVCFIDQHWGQLLRAMGSANQFENTAGCLKLLTESSHLISRVKAVSDPYISGMLLLRSLRRYLCGSWDVKERQRCLNVVLVSLYNAEIKNQLCALWEDHCRNSQTNPDQVKI